MPISIAEWLRRSKWLGCIFLLLEVLSDERQSHILQVYTEFGIKLVVIFL